MVFSVALRMPSSLPRASAAATVGSSRVDTDPVIAEGKRIKGIAMPEKTPNNVSASSEVMPESTRWPGIRMASPLCKSVSSTRLAARGRARTVSSL